MLDDGHEDVDVDVEDWRADMIRTLRRLWLLGAVAEVAVIVMLISQGEWTGLIPVGNAMLVLLGSRWILSDRGQAWVRNFRGE